MTIDVYIPIVTCMWYTNGNQISYIFVVTLYSSSTVQHELPNGRSINRQTKRFTYSEVVAFTDNFERVLGEGGFGIVHHGSLNGTQPIAVKLLSQSSVQGYKEFKAEVC